ncbi:MAG: hypothetical protein U9N56_03740 [Actinomycetota bacterium]|nr:hypothetical protein [Actinomycetota bacterium]
MSLFSTITHPEAPGLRGVSPRGIGTMVLVLAVGMGLGFVVSNIDTTAETDTAAVATGLSHAEFLRLNITDLEWMKPAVPAVPRIEPQPRVDRFIEANIDSYGWLNQIVAERHAVEPAFEAVNTNLGVYGPYDMDLANRLAPFIAVNIGSYGALIEGWEQAHEVDPGFIELNTIALEYPYTEPTSGPR